MGARHVTSVEYNQLTYDHDQLTTTLPRDLVVPAGGMRLCCHIHASPPTPGFDIAFSQSSFDHDGLGRYGDPIDALADLKVSPSGRNSQC